MHVPLHLVFFTQHYDFKVILIGIDLLHLPSLPLRDCQAPGPGPLVWVQDLPHDPRIFFQGFESGTWVRRLWTPGFQGSLGVGPRPGRCCYRNSYSLLNRACQESSSPFSHHRRVDPLTGQVENARPELSGVLLFSFHHLRKEGPPRPARPRGLSGPPFVQLWNSHSAFSFLCKVRI